MKQPKYRKDRRVETVVAAVVAILDGRWLYLRDKPLSPKWMAHQSVALLAAYIRGGVLFHAVETAQQFRGRE